MNDLIYADNKARMADYDRADRQEDELKEESRLCSVHQKRA